MMHNIDDQRGAGIGKVEAISAVVPGLTDKEIRAAEKALESAFSEDEMRF